MTKSKNIKKITSIVLVIVTLLSTFAITASAASYSTGTYTVAANSGINVRSGAGTNYSRVGAASKGVSFKVTKVNGSWGYTSSIKCTSGYKSGYVSLDYCTKTSSSSSSSSSYSTGTYSVTASNGINVRKGAGTGYSTVGAASRNVSFTVSKVSGSWGYSSRIRCTNGYRSGWVALNYCKKVSSTSSSTSTNSIRLSVPLYKQKDSRWANTYIGSKTIGSVGCTTTCIAMVYSYNTGKTVYPNAVMKKLRYSNNDLYWSSISNVGLTSIAYNSGVTNSMLSTIYSKLKAGKPVIIGAISSSGSYQHWVVITGYTGTGTTSFSTGNFLINDPGSQSCTTLKAFLANGNNADRTRIVRIMF